MFKEICLFKILLTKKILLCSTLKIQISVFRKPTFRKLDPMVKDLSEYILGYKTFYCGCHNETKCLIMSFLHILYILFYCISLHPSFQKLPCSPVHLSFQILLKGLFTVVSNNNNQILLNVFFVMDTIHGTLYLRAHWLMQ